MVVQENGKLSTENVPKMFMSLQNVQIVMVCMFCLVQLPISWCSHIFCSFVLPIVMLTFPTICCLSSSDSQIFDAKGNLKLFKDINSSISDVMELIGYIKT